MSSDEQRRDVETWFRRRGLPLVVHREVRGYALLQRTTPALVFLLVLEPLVSLITKLLDVPERDFEHRLNNPPFVIGLLAISLAALVVPVLAGWLTSRWLRVLAPAARLVLAWVVVVLNVVVMSLVERLTGLRDGVLVNLVVKVIAVVLLLFLVYVGAGSILAWGLRHALLQIGSIGTIASRALPLLVLVTMFSFFSTETWQVADELQRWRLWLVVGFLAALLVLFLIAMLSDELRTMADRVEAGQTGTGDPAAAVDLGTTPLAPVVATDTATDTATNTAATTNTVTDTDTATLSGASAGRYPLRLSERVNVTLVLFVAQAWQILLLATLVFGLFLLFGAIAVEQTVIESWLGEPPAPGRLFGLALPVSNALVHVSLFLAMFSGLYFAASAVTDQHYRSSFFEPLLADVRLSLAARQVYLARWGTAGNPE